MFTYLRDKNKNTNKDKNRSRIENRFDYKATVDLQELSVTHRYAFTHAFIYSFAYTEKKKEELLNKLIRRLIIKILTHQHVRECYCLIRQALHIKTEEIIHDENYNDLLSLIHI